MVAVVLPVTLAMSVSTSRGKVVVVVVAVTEVDPQVPAADVTDIEVAPEPMIVEPTVAVAEFE